jgi:primosomal protein N' (replication factor Y)
MAGWHVLALDDVLIAMSDLLILHIAIDAPLYSLFDYRAPANTPVQPGCRVQVPFGRSTVVGVVMAVSSHSELPASKLKSIIAVLDEQPLLPAGLLELLRWAAEYYQHPVGEVVASALPVWLREGKALDLSGDARWQLTVVGQESVPEVLARAPRQQALFNWLQQQAAADSDMLDAFSDTWRPAMQGLVEKGLAQKILLPCLESSSEVSRAATELNPEQQSAVNSVARAFGRFQTFLLQGITGSGKTEVYLALTRALLAQGKQVLVLVPEISLTPQLTRRFRENLSCTIAALHSGLNDRQRQCAWGMAASGQAQVVIGTRSALFTPLPQLGLIIIDEEHDASFKQQEGFRYHARDLALVRAKHLNIPVLLGSATPALESLHNASRGQFELVQLHRRAASASAPPRVQVLDVRRRPMSDGLSDVLLNVVRDHLARQGQVLLFLNRRGYAPLLMCHACGWTTDCPRCDAHMTLHQHSRRLHCHHCGHEKPAPAVCPQCGQSELYVPGAGTERIELALAQLFPEVRISRIDRDTTRRKGALDDKLEQARSGAAQILIGTQMLAKGHDFPNVSLVGILDADQGLFSTDFRGAEHLAQLIVQVAGRAGRADKPGEVLIQTHHPDHPLLTTLLQQGYAGFARAALEERRLSELPPFSHLAVLRAEAPQQKQVAEFLQQARELLLPAAGSVQIFGPLPAPMARRAGRQRMQLVLQAGQRKPLQNLLRQCMRELAKLKSAARVRWSVDVDPVDLY